MEKKKIQKPFSIEAWKKGAKVETKDGRAVRILCTDADSSNGCIVGLVNEIAIMWSYDGKFCNNGKRSDFFDLVIVEEVEEPERWADKEDEIIEGYYIDIDSAILSMGEVPLHLKKNVANNHNVFATEKQAKSAVAMARISQLMANDERFGGVVTDEEWKNNKLVKCVIYRSQGAIARKEPIGEYHFLAFHTAKQRDLFLRENEQLIKDFLIVD